MFKAKLIKSDDYYKLRTKQYVYIILGSFPIGIVANFFNISLPILILGIAAYIMIEYFTIKNQKLMSSLLGQRKIEIQADRVNIYSAKGKIEKSIDITDVNTISLNENVGFAQQNMTEIRKELQGRYKKNFISLTTDHGAHRYDFEIESYYMIVQFNKIIQHWKYSGKNIITLSESQPVLSAN